MPELTTDGLLLESLDSFFPEQAAYGIINFASALQANAASYKYNRMVLKEPRTFLNRRYGFSRFTQIDKEKTIHIGVQDKDCAGSFEKNKTLSEVVSREGIAVPQLSGWKSF